MFALIITNENGFDDIKFTKSFPEARTIAINKILKAIAHADYLESKSTPYDYDVNHFLEETECHEDLDDYIGAVADYIRRNNLENRFFKWLSKQDGGNVNKNYAQLHLTDNENFFEITIEASEDSERKEIDLCS